MSGVKEEMEDDLHGDADIKEEDADEVMDTESATSEEEEEDGSSGEEESESGEEGSEEEEEEEMDSQEQAEGEDGVEAEDDGNSTSEYEWVTDDEDHSQNPIPGTSGAQDDSSSGEDCDKCPICLAKFRDQDVGTPEGCDHDFCLECILEWSNNVNTCPQDRQVFHLVLAKHCQEGTVYKRIPVKDKTLQLEDETVNDTTDCEICGRSDREDRLLLCDGCDLGYHLDCLTPPLSRVPAGTWFCPECSGAEQQPAVPERQTAGGRRMPPRRQIARTVVAQRVLAIITSDRLIRRRRIVSSESEFDGEEDGDDASAVPRQRKTPAKKTPTKRRKTKRRKTRRKTTKRKTTKPKKTTSASSTGVTKKRKVTKRKRKTTKGKKRKVRRKKVKARTAKATPTTVKSRIADKLGMSKPPVGRTMPLVRGQSQRSIEQARDSIGISSLDIMGSSNALGPHYSSDEEMLGAGENGGSTMVARPVVPRFGPCRTKAALKAHPSSLIRNGLVRLQAPSCGVAPIDLLGDILKGQDMLSRKSEEITIHKDGSLEAKKSADKRLIKNSPDKSERSSSLPLRGVRFSGGRQGAAGDSPGGQEGGGSATPPRDDNPDSTGDVDGDYTGGDGDEGSGDAAAGAESSGAGDIGGDDAMDNVGHVSSENNGRSPDVNSPDQEARKESTSTDSQDKGAKNNDDDDDDDNDLTIDLNESNTSVAEEPRGADNSKAELEQTNQSAEISGSVSSTLPPGGKAGTSAGVADSTVQGGLYDGEEISIGGFPLNTFSSKKPKISIKIGKVRSSKPTEDTRKVVLDKSKASSSGGAEMYDPSMPSEDLSGDSQAAAADSAVMPDSSNENVSDNKQAAHSTGTYTPVTYTPPHVHEADVTKEVENLEGSIGSEEEGMGNPLQGQEEEEAEEEEGLHIVPRSADTSSRGAKKKKRSSRDRGDPRAESGGDKSRSRRKERSSRRRGRESEEEEEGHSTARRRHSHSPDYESTSRKRHDSRGADKSRERQRRRSRSRESAGGDEGFRSVERAAKDKRSVHERKSRRSRSEDERNGEKFSDAKNLVVSRENTEDSDVVIIDDTSEEEEYELSGGAREEGGYSREERGGASHRERRDRDRRDRSGDRSGERGHRRDEYGRDEYRRRSRDRDNRPRDRTRDRDRERDTARDRDRDSNRDRDNRADRDRGRYSRDDRDYDRHYPGRSRDQEDPAPIGLAKVFRKSIKEIEQTDKNTSGRAFKRKQNSYADAATDKYQDVTDSKRSRDSDEHVRASWDASDERDTGSASQAYDSGSSKSRDSSGRKKKNKKKSKADEVPDWVTEHGSKKDRALADTYLGHKLGLSKSSQGSSMGAGDTTKADSSTEYRSNSGGLGAGHNQPHVAPFKIPPPPRSSTKPRLDIFAQESLPPPASEKGPLVAKSPLLPLPADITPRFVHVSEAAGMRGNFIVPPQQQQPVSLPVMGLLRSVNPSLLLAPPGLGQRGFAPRVYQRVQPPMLPLLQTPRGPLDNGMPLRAGALLPGQMAPRPFSGNHGNQAGKHLQVQNAQVKQLLDLVTKQQMLTPRGPKVTFKGKQPSAEDKDTTHLDMEVESPGSDYGPSSLTPPSVDDRHQQPSSSDDNKPGTPLGDKILKLMKAVSDKKRGAPLQQDADSSPTSAVELDKRQKLLKKMNRQERVVEEVKLAIKPYYEKGKIDKDEYKDILRKSVPRICKSKNEEINASKIRSFIEAYVTKVRQTKKYMAKKEPEKKADSTSGKFRKTKGK